MVNRVIFVNGPDPTGFGFVHVARSGTFEKMCCGTTICRFSCAAMNCESGVFRLITTPYGPFRWTEAMFVPSRSRPIRSATLFWAPALRL